METLPGAATTNNIGIGEAAPVCNHSKGTTVQNVLLWQQPQEVGVKYVG